MKIRPGRNIALKIPRSTFAATVHFYELGVGLPLEQRDDDLTVSYRAPFGSSYLWLDAVSGLGKADVWLDLFTDDLEAATKHLEAHGAVRRDEIEPLPPGVGHWLADPAGNTILLAVEKETEIHLPRAIPQLPSAELTETALFYERYLGFGVRRNVAGEKFLIVARDDSELHFWEAGSAEEAIQIGTGSSCYFRTPHVQALFDEFTERGAPFRYPLEDKPWGMREFQIDDPVGIALRFGWPAPVTGEEGS